MISNGQAIGEVTAICLLVFFWALFVQGCGVGQYSASTTATYQITPDGKFISYTSTKEMQGLDLKLTEVDGKITGVEIHVDKATTNERAIAAALQMNLKLVETIEALIAKGAAGGK